MTSGSRLMRACPQCGYERQIRPTSNPVCVACRRYDRYVASPEDALTGGYWTVVRGVHKWVSYEHA